jgi:hypothetical protein
MCLVVILLRREANHLSVASLGSSPMSLNICSALLNVPSFRDVIDIYL